MFVGREIAPGLNKCPLHRDVLNYIILGSGLTSFSVEISKHPHVSLILGSKGQYDLNFPLSLPDQFISKDY